MARTKQSTISTFSSGAPAAGAVDPGSTSEDSDVPSDP